MNHPARRLAALLLALAALLAAPTRAAEPARDYVIGPGDVVKVAVFQSPDLTLETRVPESGSIGYPLLGQVRLAGLSVTQAEHAIAAGLRDGNFIKQPQVTLMVLQVRGSQVSVLGLVARPGRYPLESSGMRLSELIALAGGVAPGGSDRITLNGSRGGKPYRAEVDLPALLVHAQGDDPVIMNGDVVYVDRMPTVYIYGEVQRPGALRLERDMTVMQALAAGGGLTLRGTDRGLRVHRKGGDGKLVAMQPALDDRLQDGDVVFVRESLF
jgi:polysaccharide export outer membrane protein